jgi:hypothetical protein
MAHRDDMLKEERKLEAIGRKLEERDQELKERQSKLDELLASFPSGLKAAEDDRQGGLSIHSLHGYDNDRMMQTRRLPSR